MTSGDEKRQTDAFVEGVLGRTTGQGCQRAHGQLQALLDNQLDGLDRQLVQAHLEHCTDCRAVAVTVGWLQPLLPAMAEVELQADFLSGVLARTSRVAAPRNMSVHPSGVAGLMDRVGQWWQGQIMRPGFAFQAAYVATVVLVVLVYTTPLRSVPGQALDLVSAGPAEMPLVGPLLGESSQWLTSERDRVLADGRAQVSRRKDRMANGLLERLARTANSRQQLSQHLDNAVAEMQARSAAGVSREMVGALRSSRTAWALWWQATAKNSETRSESISETISETTSGP